MVPETTSPILELITISPSLSTIMKRLSSSLLLISVLALLTPQFVHATFDPREATIQTVHNSLFSNLTTCREVVSSFISRIQAFNPTINAIISLNPSALAIADSLDADLAAGKATGKLFCVPVLLKDNYDAVGMNTTAGCEDLKDSVPNVDAPSVSALKREGAIILGKANLHELALEGLSVSSLGGQTINPYDHTRTPGGSSGGTGASIATSFAVFGTGTDTVNSLRSPASANNLFSVRPTRGLISRSGVVPISFTQDAVGPIARSLEDLAVALTVMANVGYDPADNTTALVPAANIGLDYSQFLSGDGTRLNGVRLGMLEGFFNRTESDETTPVNEVMDSMVQKLESAGATVVRINETVYNATSIAFLDVQQFEYRQEMDAYLQRPSLSGTHPRTLNELYASGQFLVIPAQYSYVNNALVSSTSNLTNSTYAPIKLEIQNLITTLQTTFVSNELDAIIYPEQKNLVVKIGSPSQSGRNGILGAITGSPVVTVPAGFSGPDEDAPLGVPIGMEILGRPWTEGKLLGIAKGVVSASGGGGIRRIPEFARGAVDAGMFESVPVITPDTKNIPTAYPLGTL